MSHSTEKERRVPPDCWPVCEYGVSCTHEWRVIPPGSPDDSPVAGGAGDE